MKQLHYIGINVKERKTGLLYPIYTLEEQKYLSLKDLFARPQ